MHEIEPFYRWEKYYNATEDAQSPFYGKQYETTYYTNDIYGYYIHPFWDYIGSETLYIKVLYANYDEGYMIIEMLGEWNDTLYNDIMFLKRNIVDHFLKKSINKFILIGENVLNFHGSDDCYYEEWFDDVEEGWIAGINFRDFVIDEWKKYNLDWYINYGGDMEIVNWRTLKPQVFCHLIDQKIQKRISLI
ncbi:hypothetical protein AAG747_01585 [Rapidithrix thailandica]|uniref:Uncharacterized protein n=1 Tax=Rapidithrix thailandica TaxID=413964 RepID=A0AAW9RYF1_9BACT